MLEDGKGQDDGEQDELMGQDGQDEQDGRDVGGQVGQGGLEGHDELMGQDGQDEQDGLEGHDEQMGQDGRDVQDGGWRRDRPKPRPQGGSQSTAPSFFEISKQKEIFSRGYVTIKPCRNKSSIITCNTFFKNDFFPKL